MFRPYKRKSISSLEETDIHHKKVSAVFENQIQIRSISRENNLPTKMPYLYRVLV